MTRTTFMDSILNRPSQRYTEPVSTKPSRNARYQPPSDLPNAPNRPDSILAGSMFKGTGPGSLAHGAGVYSQAPSVMSAKSNTSRFSIFRKKGRKPSISAGSVYHDGASSIAPTDVSASPRKGRWWEAGSLTRKEYSRPPSIAGSVFSEPEVARPPGFPRISDSLKGSAPPRAARSDYGGPTSSRTRHPSHPAPPPVPSLANRSSMSALRRHSGVAPLGQQQPNLMRQASATSISGSNDASNPARPVSPAASMGRARSPNRAAPKGSSDWNSFVKSMSGTEVAKMWETMPTLAPKPARTGEKRSSMVASRVKKELEQDAQFQQVQRDPAVVQQDLLARAASQVIGEMPPTPVSLLSEQQPVAVHLQPGQIVTPVSPIYSPVGSSSSINIAHYPTSMSLQASAVMYDASAPAPVNVPQSAAPVPIILAPLQHQQKQEQQYAQPQATSYQEAEAVPAVASHQVVPAPVTKVSLAPPAVTPPIVPAQTYAPVAVPAPHAVVEPPVQTQHVPPSPSLPTPVAPQEIAPRVVAPQEITQPHVESSTGAAPPPTTAQYLADRIEEEESADEQQPPPEETTPEVSEESETSSDEGLAGDRHPTLDVVTEEDEEGSSIGHDYHQEMRMHKSIKGKGPGRNYDDFEARLHLRQTSAQSQMDSSQDEVTAITPSGVRIHVTEPTEATVSTLLAPAPEAMAQTAVSGDDVEPATSEASQVKPLISAAEPALAQTQVSTQLVESLDRPQLVSRASEASDYQSATSGRSTPTTRRRDEVEDDDASAAASIAQVRISTKTSDESIAETASIAPSQRLSMRTGRSSRSGTLQRRLSDISLGTSFAVSGIMRRSTSSMRRIGDSDSDSGAELSDDDAELRAKALAEQDRLRRMNVGEDFFGPSLSGLFDKFERFGHSDTTVNRLTRDSEPLSASFAQVSNDTPLSAAADSAPVLATESSNINAEAQKAINEVRQKRAEASANGMGNKRRNSAETGLAASFAAVWLLNQAQSNESPSAERNSTEDAGDETITDPILQTSASRESGLSTSAEKPRESVLNRPRPKSQRPHEMGGVAISQGRLEAEKPQSPVEVEDTRSTLPMSLSRSSVKSATSPVAAAQDSKVSLSAASPMVASKDKPAPANRKVSADSVGSTSVKSEHSSIVDSIKRSSSSSDSTSISAAVTSSHGVPASPSAKAVGKQRALDDVSAAAPEEPTASSAMVPSETANQFTTPSQSMASLQSPAVSPEKYHTAHDLKALADSAIPAYPTELQKASVIRENMVPSVTADVRPEHQRKLSEQMKSMGGFGSFKLPQLEGHQVSAQIAESSDLPAVEEAAQVHETTSAAEDIQAESDVAAAAISTSLTAPVRESVVEDAVSIPTSSEASVVSTALTSPEVEAASKQLQSDNKAVVTEVTSSELAPTIPVAMNVAEMNVAEMNVAEKKLPLPPPPAMEDVMTVAQDDRTPIGKPQTMPGVGINLIPPTPPALESRNSFTSSQVPAIPNIAEHNDYVAPQRPPLMSRSSSQRTAVRGDSKPNASSETLARSKSMAFSKKGIWQEYKGKGLSLPPGLVATTIDSSTLRRMSSQDKKHQAALAPAPTPAAPAQATPVAPVVGQVVALAPGSVLESPPRAVRSTSSRSPKSTRAGVSPAPFTQSPSMTRKMAEAPPVPPIPVGYQGAGSVSSSSSRLYAYSVGSSEQGWDSRSVSPAPSAVPSQSARSVGSHVSSSIHSNSYRSSPRPEYTYVNHHELSPYAKKLRSLSPSPAVPTLTQTGNRHSLMSAINEWESQVPETESVTGLSPYPSRPVSPQPYPTLPASTVSRSSSVISVVSSPALVRNAPLGASTNQYLHPPIARSRMSADELPSVSESVDESISPSSVVGRADSVCSSSPSASQSALSLSSTIPTSMPTIPTSYRPNKDPNRFSTNVENLLNNRTTMQTVAVTSGAFGNKSRTSVVKRKKSVDLNNGDRRLSSDLPEHLQDELSLTTLSITAHTPPPRKIGSHQVLVQVIAVAIDETDKLLLRDKVKADNAFGFVPGRSFCGRIVECGYEVKKMRKGDVVFGLQDSRKSGALAEFMVVEYHRICHAPSDCLTTEQIAALPSAGVMAHQLVQNHCRQLSRGARVLILNAHDGVGLLTMQESVGLGLVIVAQCPPSVSDGVAVCQANGAHEVVIGEPLWAINSLHESSFDLIVDTVGGRKIYDASRRILASEGQFCTCFGDEHGTANPNLKSHFRSLRRAFFKKDKKNIGYEWVGVDNGEDCKEALEAVKRAAESGAICPRLRSVLPFGDAPRAFDPTSRNVTDEPGAIVVRVS
uniref:Zinc-binding oxidoreductase n=1 Tax=Melanopsichium pennsylvanicum 4 TaxID=1398559 RepID=A0A077R5E2_9BASI|nr:zinc-binding oxidoreductase [Melanopsichium pennsylvanicum 4]